MGLMDRSVANPNNLIYFLILHFIKGHIYNLRTPQKVFFDENASPVVNVACGASWSFALRANGEFYGWGNGDGKSLYKLLFIILL